MRAVSIERPGGYERLRIVERGTPPCGPSEVRVATRAIGINYADCVVRMGLYRSAKEFVGWPITPGFEFSGEVREVGANVTGFSLGQRVFGVSLFGAYATELCVPSRQVFELPDEWSFEEAGAFPVAFLTAWYGLREQCRLRPGMNVLIHSGAGGVGGAAIQIARACGCRVMAVVGSSDKVETARGLGADTVIDRSKQDVWAEAERWTPQGYDVILDPNGGQSLRQSDRHLRATGRLIIYGFQHLMSRGKPKPGLARLAYGYLTTPRFNPLEMTNANRTVAAFNLSYLAERMDLLDEAMGELMGWVADGLLRPLSVRTLPFESVAEAQRLLESGTTVGKLALSVAPEKDLTNGI